MSDVDWKNWRRRRFLPAAAAAGLDVTRAYDLRHAFASLLLHHGESVIEGAAQLGHAPSMFLDTYGHLISELRGAERISPEAAIRAARAESAPRLDGQWSEFASTSSIAQT